MVETVTPDIKEELTQKFPDAVRGSQETCDGIPTLWIAKEQAKDILRHLKYETDRPYSMLYDLTAVDERERQHRPPFSSGDFSVLYHLLSFDRNADIRLKVDLQEDSLSLPSITELWPAANWYEREVWDMFGIEFDGHPHLRRNSKASCSRSCLSCGN